MKICRFNFDKLGLIEGDVLRDVSAVLEGLPGFRWARPLADPVIERLPTLRTAIETATRNAPVVALSDVTLEAPVAAPTKIIGAPVNYHAHMEEALEDQALHQGRKVHPIDEIGCFLKAGSSLVGSGAVIQCPAGQDRVDYEGEIAVIIGKAAKDVPVTEAMDYVAGYALALDCRCGASRIGQCESPAMGFPCWGQ